MPLAPSWSDDHLIELLHDAANAAGKALGNVENWGLAGTREGQYHADLAADAAVTRMLLDAGVGVLSEESGIHAADRPIIVVVDPLDGSTNASRGLGWYATSLCAVDGDGARAALVVDIPRQRRFTAQRGHGARLDSSLIVPSACTEMSQALVALSGFPSRYLGWAQYRSFGAVALDLCEVARGGLDGFIDCSPSAHGSWDYLGGMLICQEAGALVGDAEQRDLLALDHAARLTPLAAATPELFDQLSQARAGLAD